MSEQLDTTYHVRFNSGLRRAAQSRHCGGQEFRLEIGRVLRRRARLCSHRVGQLTEERVAITKSRVALATTAVLALAGLLTLFVFRATVSADDYVPIRQSLQTRPGECQSISRVDNAVDKPGPADPLVAVNLFKLESMPANQVRQIDFNNGVRRVEKTESGRRVAMFDLRPSPAGGWMVVQIGRSTPCPK